MKTKSDAIRAILDFETIHNHNKQRLGEIYRDYYLEYLKAYYNISDKDLECGRLLK